MPSPNATPTPITPPRVPLIDPRTGLIDRAWYLFFLSLNNIATNVVENVNVATDSISLIASYDAALRALAQEVETQPPPVDLSAELIKQIEAAGLIDCCSGLLSQIAEIQKQIDALNASPNLRPPSVADVSGLGTMAVQNADAVAITGGTINNTVIGGTTPAAGTFTTLIGGGGSANYGQLTGGATTKAVEFKTLGSDTNISQVFQSKGTGAIDLAAGSSGVNISNGGTVTAITRTAAGSLYTSFPSLAISAPTTVGGVQATAAPSVMIANAATIAAGGTGYTVGNVVTLSGGTPIVAATFTVTAVSGGVVTAVTSTNFGTYSVLPSNPVSTTGGTGSGLTLNVTWAVGTTFTITNAGSGYVEQPTVSFSGGGGSGAAAYATVGAGSVIRSLGSTGTQSLSFNVPSGEVLRLRDTGSAGTYVMVNTTASGANLVAQGATNAFFGFNSNGTSAIQFGTNGNTGNTQMQVSHTASAVNYVQVTGAATLSPVQIQAQGSDGNIGVQIKAKGSSAISFWSGGGAYQQFRISNANNAVNNFAVAGTTAGNSPILSVEGTDTNIDLTLTPKGTGNVRFGTYTGTISAITGYIEIKDSGGTVRRLAVVA